MLAQTHAPAAILSQMDEAVAVSAQTHGSVRIILVRSVWPGRIDRLSKPMGKPTVNRLILTSLTSSIGGEYMNHLLSKTHVGMVVKAETLWVLAVPNRNAWGISWVFAWEHGVWKAPKQNAWAKRNAKQNALGQLHLDCHGLPEQRFSQKIEIQSPNENNT